MSSVLRVPLMLVLANQTVVWAQEKGDLMVTAVPENKPCSNHRLTLWQRDGDFLDSLYTTFFKGDVKRFPTSELGRESVTGGKLNEAVAHIISAYEPVEREYAVHVWTSLSFYGVKAKGAREAANKGDQLAADFLEAAEEAFKDDVEGPITVPEEMSNFRLYTHCEDSLIEDQEF